MGTGEKTLQGTPRLDLAADPQALPQPSVTPDGPISELLERLASGKVNSAWSEFLERYSSLIMHVARRHERDPVRATDCFLHVCAALSDDGFRRLLSFRPDGPARFRTWLTAVVANLCIDWTRRQQGRFRPIRAIAGLPELEQLVYRYIYVRGMRRADCTRLLEPRFPGLTEQTVSEINARLFSLVTPQQRWQLNLHPATSARPPKVPRRTTPNRPGSWRSRTGPRRAGRAGTGLRPPQVGAGAAAGTAAVAAATSLRTGADARRGRPADPRTRPVSRQTPDPGGARCPCQVDGCLLIAARPQNAMSCP